jgi:hypothetical protein
MGPYRSVCDCTTSLLGGTNRISFEYNMSAAVVFLPTKSDYLLGRSDENAEISFNRAFPIYVCQLPTHLYGHLAALFPIGLKFLSTLTDWIQTKRSPLWDLQPKLLSGMRVTVECLSTLKILSLSYPNEFSL